MLERVKAQFPVNAGIMVSGTVKRSSYDGKLTFDKPNYSIMTGEFLEDKMQILIWHELFLSIQYVKI